MKSLISLFALLGLTVSLAGCVTPGFIINSHVVAGGINYSPVTGATLGYGAANHTLVPIAGQDKKQLLYPDQCGRKGPPPVVSVQAGNASANLNFTGPNAGAPSAPSVAATTAVNQGLLVGEPARLEELAKIQAAAGQNHAVLSEYNACPQSKPTEATGAATSTPAQ